MCKQKDVCTKHAFHYSIPTVVYFIDKQDRGKLFLHVLKSVRSGLKGFEKHRGDSYDIVNFPMYRTFRHVFYILPVVKHSQFSHLNLVSLYTRYTMHVYNICRWRNDNLSIFKYYIMKCEHLPICYQLCVVLFF